MKTEHDNLLPESERLSFAWNVTPSHWRDDKQNPFGHTVTAIAFEISPRNPDGNTSRRMSFKNGKKRDPVKYGPMKQLFFKFPSNPEFISFSRKEMPGHPFPCIQKASVWVNGIRLSTLWGGYINNARE
ncbi:hypothetical protein TNCT_724381 [Trichonephila clavata]|uniref:Uncharacterized protein n=1 Tax=Trichonephila clavata TaxID=2740835 RepID=A0A8X6JAF3_TRICU|nr:hypothetical protein TNCT_724381 [Trichonephila clavata]